MFYWQEWKKSLIYLMKNNLKIVKVLLSFICFVFNEYRERGHAGYVQYFTQVIFLLPF